jgi:hypothetical protein
MTLMIKSDFSLKVDPEVVENILNIKNVAQLKDAVLGALKASGGRDREILKAKTRLQVLWRDYRL